MKKEYSLKALEDMPLTSISFISCEGTETGEWRSQRPTLDSEKCTQCGLCWMYCPDNAIKPEKDRYGISYKYCKGCGICAKECPQKAISMVTEKR